MIRKHAMIAAFASATAFAGSAMAEVVIEIDLSVENQITISATGGLSAVTTTASNFNGFYFENFFGGSGSSLSSSLISGDISTFNDPADGSALLYRSGSGVDAGLNVWSFSTNGTVSWTEGVQAFSGSSTWTVSAEIYAEALAGSTFGDVWSNADSADDAHEVVGQYSVVPAPGALALLGLAGVAGRRRRN